MTDFIKIANNGPEISETNYWETELAKKGFCYLSWNAGDARLLVPEMVLGIGVADEALREIRTGKFVKIQIRQHAFSGKKLIHIVFDDESDAPFSITISAQQMDRSITEKDKGSKFKFSAWDKTGKKLELSGIIE